MYFKTSGGNWVAASEDEDGRLFMIDEIGDLYYDSGEPDIGLYAVSGWGSLPLLYAVGGWGSLPLLYTVGHWGSLPLLYAVGGWGSLHSNSRFMTYQLPFSPSHIPPQMDTQGNLYNFYQDIDGERKITPVGNVSDLQQFKVRTAPRYLCPVPRPAPPRPSSSSSLPRVCF